MRQAHFNVAAIKAQKSLAGHIVPYIQRDQAEEYTIEADAANGWFDRLQREDIPQNEIDLDTMVEEQTSEILRV